MTADATSLPAPTVVRRAAVLGHPVAHSLSPLLHRAAYAALGLDQTWRYDAYDVTLDGLAEFVAQLDETWAGLSLTMPHKQLLLELVDHVDPLATVIGAGNTLLMTPGKDRPQMVALNTDVHGVVAALAEGLGSDAPDPERRAVVIGAGATAASTLAALAQLGCTRPDVLVRSASRAAALLEAAERMGVEPQLHPLEQAPGRLIGADVVVSTLPSHGPDAIAYRLLDLGAPISGVLLDVAYDPRPSALGLAWETLGGVAISGERMLLHQAVEQVRLMTGLPGPLAAMDAALQEHLARLDAEKAAAGGAGRPHR